MDAKVTHIFLKDPALVERLQQQAGRERRTKTAIVTRALERYFADEQGPPGAPQALEFQSEPVRIVSVFGRRES